MVAASAACPAFSAASARHLAHADAKNRSDQCGRSHGQGTPRTLPNGTPQNTGTACGCAKTAQDGKRKECRHSDERHDLRCGASMATSSGTTAPTAKVMAETRAA